MSKNIKRVAYIGLLAAFAVVISYVESLLPINIGIPGVKPGFANFVIVIALYEFNVKDAFMINLIRILIVGMMFGNLFSILFSISGAVVSLIVMALVKKIKGMSLFGVSVAGGVAHNVGQLIVAAFVVNTYTIGYYIPVLIIAGIITGILVGIPASIVRGVLHKILVSERIN